MSKNCGKKPWIPPGKATLKKKLVQKHLDASSSILSEPMRVDLKEDDSNITFTVSSIASNFPSADVHQIHSMFPALKHELHLLRLHCVSLKTSSEYLHRAFDVSKPNEHVTKELIAKIDQYVVEFDIAFNELENTADLLESNAKMNGNQYEEYKKLNKSKEYLLSRMLETYECVIAILQVALETQKNKSMSGLSNEKEALRKELKSVSKKVITQEAIITDQARRLAVFQGKVNAMDTYKASLENSKTNLQKQLLYKESQIKFLSEELSKANFTGEEKNDNEALMEIIEELKNTAKVEKEALKKALKAQKAQAKAANNSLNETKKELEAKVQYLYEIAEERDHWKVQLTVAKNSIIEYKTKLEEIKRQNLRLESLVNDSESSSKDEAGKLKENLQLLGQLREQNVKLSNEKEELMQQCDNLKTELKRLKENQTKIKDDSVRPAEDQCKLDEALREMKNLGDLLQSTKEIFSSSKLAVSYNNIMGSGDNMSKATNDINSQNNIAHMVQETKEYLLEIKKVYNLFLDAHQKSPDEPDKRFQELESLYNHVVKENKKLQDEIDLMKNNLAKSTQVKSLNHNELLNTRSIADSTKKLSFDFKDKNEELQSLYQSFQQKERNHVSEIQQLREKIIKQETQNENRIINLKDELSAKKMEITKLEQIKNEEEDRLRKKIRDLQETLDRTSASYESLQKYVQILKSSYLNVFGTS